MPDLSNLLNPKSICLIGASKNPAKIGGIVLKNLQEGFKGQIYPVNTGETEINGLECFPKVSDLPATPDLAIIAIPVNLVIVTLEEIGQSGIKNVLIYTAGFKEIGESGAQIEKELIAVSQKYDLTVLGPNCLGFVNNSINLNATFGQVPRTPGNLKIISQSGAIATAIFDWCQTNNLGIDQFITIGNKSLINENDILQHWSKESSSSPIGLYLESISSGEDFLKIVKELSVKQPVFIIKPGKSPEAAQAMRSHTGSLAGADDVLEAALSQANIIRCQTLSEFFNLAKTLSWGKIPKGANVGIISNAGGPGVISADAVAVSSLKMAKLTPDTENTLSKLLPRMSGLHNPIDVLGDALSDRFVSALETILPEEEVNSVIVILTPQLMTEIDKTAKAIGDMSHKYQKPILCSFIGGKQVLKGDEILNQYQVPNFAYPEEAVITLEKIYHWQQKNISIPNNTVNFLKPNVNLINQTIKLGKNTGLKLLNPELSQEILNLLQINAPSTITTNNLSQAENFAINAGWPVVLKTSQKDLLHKTEVGGVVTGIDSINKLITAWNKLIAIGSSVQVQKQISSGVEIILGFKKDSVFGNTLLFGLGGKFVSLIQDKNLCIFPLSYDQIKKLIESSKAFKLLSGFRGDQVYDLEKIISSILKLGFIFENCPEILEMEVNPVIINNDGCHFVDTKIILK